MSRKTRRSAKVMPASRPARSAVHHRRHRGIRHFRKTAPAPTPSRKARVSTIAVDQSTSAWDWPAPVTWVCVMLLGCAACLSVAALLLSLDPFDASYAPHVRAFHLVPLAVIIAAALGAFCPTLLASKMSIRMPKSSSTSISLAALATGLAAAALPLVRLGVLQCSAWIHIHFVLSDWPLRLLQFGLVLLICILPIFGLAFTARLMLAMNCQDLRSPLRTFRPALVVTLLSGITSGVLFAFTLSARPAMLLPASSLPLLLLALIAAKLPEPILDREHPEPS